MPRNRWSALSEQVVAFSRNQCSASIGMPVRLPSESAGAAKVGFLGAKAQSPYSREELNAEFNRQSANDRSGLNLSLPPNRTYDVRVGGLIPALARGAITLGPNVTFSSQSAMSLGTLAHELRHVAQLQALGILPFGNEYSRIIPAQVRYSITGDQGALYNRPGSSVFGARLEPGY